MIFSQAFLPDLMNVAIGKPNRTSLEGDSGTRRQTLTARPSERPFSAYLPARSKVEETYRTDRGQSTARTFESTQSPSLRDAPADGEETPAPQRQDSRRNELPRGARSRPDQKEAAGDEPTETSRRAFGSQSRPERPNRPVESDSEAEAGDGSQEQPRHAEASAQAQPASDSAQTERPVPAELSAEQPTPALAGQEQALLELVENFVSSLQRVDSKVLADATASAESQIPAAEASGDHSPAVRATRESGPEVLTVPRTVAAGPDAGAAQEGSLHVSVGLLAAQGDPQETTPPFRLSDGVELFHEESRVINSNQGSSIAGNIVDQGAPLQASTMVTGQAEGAPRAQTLVFEGADLASSRVADGGTPYRHQDSAPQTAAPVQSIGLPVPKAAHQELPHPVTATQFRPGPASNGGHGVGEQGALDETKLLFSTANPQGESGKNQNETGLAPKVVTPPHAETRPKWRPQQPVAATADPPELGNADKPAFEIAALQAMAGKQMSQEGENPEDQPQRQRPALSQPARAGRSEPPASAGRQGSEAFSIAGAQPSADKGGTVTVAKPAGGAAAERAQSVERLIDLALLQRKADSHRLDLLMQDERVGRVSLRLTERAGLVDAMLRADSVRGRDMLVESLPSLLDSLARRGLESSLAGNNEAKSDGREPFEQHEGRSRHPRHPQHRQRRGEKQMEQAFRLETE